MTLWISALNRLCERCGLFKPTFPTDRMSLLDLEHAATSPHRFVRTITCHDDPALQVLPFQSREHPLRGGEAPKGVLPISVDTLALIPGGRFLLTSGDRAIVLWDLGYGSKQYIKPWPASGPHHFETRGEMRGIAPTSDGKQLLVAAELW